MDESGKKPDLDRKKEDNGDTSRTSDDLSTVRKANENIRKSQGDDSGQPVIDRHR